jgi:hypothetical protein
MFHGDRRCTAIRSDAPVFDDGPQGRVTDEIVAHTPENGGNV